MRQNFTIALLLEDEFPFSRAPPHQLLFSRRRRRRQRRRRRRRKTHRAYESFVSSEDQSQSARAMKMFSVPSRVVKIGVCLSCIFRSKMSLKSSSKISRISPLFFLLSRLACCCCLFFLFEEIFFVSSCAPP